MTQDAVVFRCLNDQTAEVVVTRATACGSNCASCEACVFQNELKTIARNLVGARPGQRVLIESKSSHVYSAILLVYIVHVEITVRRLGISDTDSISGTVFIAGITCVAGAVAAASIAIDCNLHAGSFISNPAGNCRRSYSQCSDLPATVYRCNLWVAA